MPTIYNPMTGYQQNAIIWWDANNIAEFSSNFYFTDWIITADKDEVVTRGTTDLFTNGDAVTAKEETLDPSYEILPSPPHWLSLPPVCALFWGSCRTWFGTLSYEVVEEVGKQSHISFCRLGHDYAMTIIAYSYLNLLCLNNPSSRAAETMMPSPPCEH